MELLQIRWILSLVEIVVIIFLFAMPFAALLTYFERKWSALIQENDLKLKIPNGSGYWNKSKNCKSCKN